MKKQGLLAIKLMTVLVLISSCTKSRKAELADEQKTNVFAISEFGQASEESGFSAKINTQTSANSNSSLQAFDTDSKAELSVNDVNVPDRFKFMFESLPISNPSVKDFKITFSVDKDYVTGYKIAKNISELSLLEKSLATTTAEVKHLSQLAKTQNKQSKELLNEKNQILSDKNLIKSGKKSGILLVPLFKYKVEAYGVLERSKNELKEETSRLILKKSDWINATHIQLSAQTDNRLVVGLNVSQLKQLRQLYSAEKLNHQVMSANELQKKISVGMKFIKDDTLVFTRLDSNYLNIYEITNIMKLNETQQRLLKNNAGNQTVISCQDSSVAMYLKSSASDCVLVLVAGVPVAYKNAKLAEVNELGGTGDKIELEDAQQSQNLGLIEIKENSAAKQFELSANSTLDPNNTIRLSDLKGEFFYRRTFESASNMFLGRAGTSGDIAIIKFELEDDRIVVRNQKSLIEYTGQGAKDREELMSFPVSYFKLTNTDAMGNRLTVAKQEKTTKEKAEYAQIDWTKNTVPDAVSPLAFYSGGSCFAANSSLSVTDTDMRLANDGVLNFSLSGSYTVKPTPSCVTKVDANSYYWKGSYQFNFNVTERVSFLKHKDPKADIQFADNISGMAQEAFNFGVFTLADKVTTNGALTNRDGSEKYMPIIHDFRNGKKLKYYLGGIHNTEVTNPERKKILVEGAQQVIAEWNRILRMSFRGTSLERASDYVELIVEEKETGHLGDLDRNYIWLQELPAENGLLGVAQPGANPRSGTIQSANVIVYTGNTFEQTKRLLTDTAASRQLEKSIEDYRKQLLEKAIEEKKAMAGKEIFFSEETEIAGSSENADAATAKSLKRKIRKKQKNLEEIIQKYQTNNGAVRSSLRGIKKVQTDANYTSLTHTELAKKLLQETTSALSHKNKDIEYVINNSTLIKKLVEISGREDVISNPSILEIEMNNVLLQQAGISEELKTQLKKRTELLVASVEFDRNILSRPGCLLYARNDANDRALARDKDEHTNLMLSFKDAYMATLSHELGHAFGLLHNFKASTDVANYEFKEDKNNPTGRNYSSIMDYISDVDQNYQGPGPYDAHAVRAAYTGLVELSEIGLKNEKLKSLQTVDGNLVSIKNLVNALGAKSYVHLRKDTLNRAGILNHYAQCSDGETTRSILCARFDTGSSATEIVKNYISDYHRRYINRNFVYDRILFSNEQKMQYFLSNIALFQKIRSFLDESIMTIILKTELTEEKNSKLIEDLVLAAKEGYMFFNELVRTPDATGVSFSDIGKRLIAVPYEYEKTVDGKKQKIMDVKILEGRSITDVKMGRDKFNTIGISDDKAAALTFLVQSTVPKTDDPSVTRSRISYLLFEKFFLGVGNPANSLIVNTIQEILTDELTAGFFAPTESIPELNFIPLSENSVTVDGDLAENGVLAATIGLAQTSRFGYDPISEIFKVATANVSSAPKDRFNVAKAGQNKQLSDTRVMFAAQNAFGTNALVTSAARNEIFMMLKPNLDKVFLQLYTADIAYMGPVNELASEQITKACEAKGEDSAECQAAMAKTLDEYLNEKPELLAKKQAADQLANNLVSKLKELNANGLLLPKELDTDESPVNLTNQVTMLRQVLLNNMNIILELKQKLSNLPSDKIMPTLKELEPEIVKVSQMNSSLEHLHLIAMSFSTVIEAFKTEVITSNDKKAVIPLSMLAQQIMKGGLIADELRQQQNTLQKLAQLSAILDPESVGK